MKLCRKQNYVDHQNTIHCYKRPPLVGADPLLIKSDPSCSNLLVVDVDSDPLAEHQLHGGRVAELHRGFDDQVNAFVRRRDAVEVHRIVDG